MVGMCQYYFGVNWCKCFFGFQMVQWWINIFCTYGEMIKSLYSVMVILYGEIEQRWIGFWGHISINGEMMKWWNAIFSSEWILMLEWKFPFWMLPWGEIVVRAIVFPSDVIPGDYCWDSPLGQFVPWEYSWHTIGTRFFQGSCPWIRWYFCTYDYTYFISSYAKLCIIYGMFLYIHL